MEPFELPDTPPNWFEPVHCPPHPPRLSSICAPRPAEPALALVEPTCQPMAAPGERPSSAHAIFHSICVPEVGPLVEPWPAPAGRLNVLTKVRSPGKE